MAGRLRAPRLLVAAGLGGGLALLAACGLLLAAARQPPAGGLSGSATVKVFTAAAGLYEISQTELQAAGLALGPGDASRLSLSYEGQPQPLWVDGANGGFALHFYAQASPSRYAPDNVYWLRLGTSAEALAPIATPLAPPSAFSADRYTATLHVEENLLYQPMVADGDHWLWMMLAAPGTQSFTLSPSALQPGPAELVLQVWGSTQGPGSVDHHLVLRFNDQLIADEQWDGAGRHGLSAVVPAGLLHAGDNRLVVDGVGDTGLAADVVGVDWVELRYPRQLVAQDGQLAWDSPGGMQRLAGLGGLATVYDITQPEAARRLDGQAAGSDTVVVGQAGHRYAAVGAGGYRRPARLEPLAAEPDLRAPGLGADYLAVGPPDLLAALAPLLEWRAAQGLRVRAIPVEAAYDQFGSGRPEPEAIRALLREAAQAWSPAPRYVLLVGDTTYDTLGYRTPIAANQLPTFFVQTAHGGEVASDEAFAEWDGARQPALAVGRLPANTPEQVAAYVAKVLRYEQSAPAGAWRGRALGVADGQSASFAAAAQDFLGALPVAYPDPVLAPADGAGVADALRAGAGLVAYFGHGSLTQWGQDALLTSAVAATLDSGGRVPVVINMTCLAGLFTHPTVTSLGESLLLNPKGGAVAVLASSGLTLPEDQAWLSRALARQLSAAGQQPLGAIFLAAQREAPLQGAGAREVLQTFLLLGDPALRLVQP